MTSKLNRKRKHIPIDAEVFHQQRVDAAKLGVTVKYLTETDLKAAQQRRQQASGQRPSRLPILPKSLAGKIGPGST